MNKPREGKILERSQRNESKRVQRKHVYFDVSNRIKIKSFRIEYPSPAEEGLKTDKYDLLE